MENMIVLGFVVGVALGVVLGVVYKLVMAERAYADAQEPGLLRVVSIAAWRRRE